MMNIEKFAQMILSLSNEAQSKAWKELETVLTVEVLETTKKYVGFFRLMTDKTFYETVQNELGKQIYKEANA